MIKVKVLEKKIRFWIPAMVWLSVIFYFSNEPSLTIGSGGVESFVLRKFAHIGEFGVLALLIFLPLTKRYKSKGILIFFATFLITALFALTDEFHQTFILGRDGNLKDVLVDSLGAFLFLQILAFILFTRRRLLLTLSIFMNLAAIFFLLNFMVNEIFSKNFSSEEQETQVNYLDQATELREKGEDFKVEVEVKKKESLAEIEKNKGEEKMDQNPQKSVVPDKILLPVPFSSQAPFGVWDEVHEEACEEMSLIMVKYYLDKKDLTPQVAEEEIQKMKDYQLEKNGHFIDSDMKELSEIARDYFDLKDVTVKYDLIKEDIIKSLIQGYPVIVPTAGRMLGNPNFSGLGPLYHNLVIIGFEGDEFITNDPGTRRGEKYRYKIDTIMDAIHDYTGNKNEIKKGAKAALFFVEK